MRHWIDIFTQPPMLAVTKPSSLLNELAQPSANGRELNHVVQVLSQHLGSLRRIGGPTRMYDIRNAGQRGAIYVVGKTLMGIGLGWKDASGVCSIYIWNVINPLNIPNYEIDLPKVGNFDTMLPQILAAIRSHQQGAIPVSISESINEDEEDAPAQTVGDAVEKNPANIPPNFQNLLQLAKAKEVKRLAGAQQIFIYGRTPTGAVFSVPGLDQISASLERMFASTFQSADGGDNSMEQQYDLMTRKIKLVASGRSEYIKSILICGAPSSGKSFNVLQTLQKELKLVEGKDYQVSKGFLTRPELYSLMIENNDRLIILDDCDGIIKDEDAVNMLKGALDTNNRREVSYRVRGTINIGVLPAEQRDEYVMRLSRVLRRVPDASDAEYFSRYARLKKPTKAASAPSPPSKANTDYDEDDPNNLRDDYDAQPEYVPDDTASAIFEYVSEHLPNVIDFKGRMIFISNLPLSSWPGAIKDRSETMDMKFSDSDMLNYIDKIKGSIMARNLTDDQKKEVLDYLRALWTTGRMGNRSINFRLVQLCFDYRLDPNWKAMMAALNNEAS